MTARDAPNAPAVAEVVRHHRVVEAWLRGDVPYGTAAFAEFADAHAPHFTMVGPDGNTMDRAAVLRAVEAAHGSAPGLRIGITDAAVVAAEHGTYVVTYREVHDGGPEPAAARRATAVLERDGGGGRRGPRWRYLHETYENLHETYENLHETYETGR
ncbi:DUF4440 domain-containing protein [Streptomyces sp. AV19]|uniref:DUF4440 domain-containing protein n=1 Tax=Streptomyces sp. AV19 TaxID=2793068 RepID=UPI0018FE3117|nr:DUF4440 domain-containing protein [Streptomyces sp. AV19]MBH1932978.1 DUF4440 domain-containing protein [Streptomyces sp. AV19]MDG4533851.1 DUF4440 domain-containing protein [Streptomyces sp. AV19]